MKTRSNVRKLAILLPATLLAILTLSVAPASYAYGSTDQWQAGFAGQCLAPSCGTFLGDFGFWGWCAFGGSDGSAAVGTTGTSADCVTEIYFTGNPVVPAHYSIDASGWVIRTGSLFLPPGVPGFFITSGTVTFQGPLAAALGLPAGIPLPLSVVCPGGPTPGSLCDTGIPAIPGHFNINPFPGFSIQIQVTKVP